MKIKVEDTKKTFQEYLNEIFAKFNTGDAAERTYYPVLENLLKKFEEGSEVIIESRNSSVGIPDFKAETSKGLLIGYIEAKDLGRDLDRLNKGEQEQIEKYLREYPKLIITNFIEFRLYEKSELVDSAVISQPVTLKIGTPVLDNEGRFKGLLERFFSTTIPKVYTSKRLSELLAHKTRVLRDLIREEIDLLDNIETNTEKLLKTFQKTLKPDMTPESFSDMYAQTITFGLFVARINSDSQEFNRYTAHTLIPQTISLLKKVFWVLSGQDVPQHIEWQVDEVAEILANTNIGKITEEFFKHGKGRDPIIHFYETFLAEYDSKQREELGVYYTPQPVVSYITKSLHKLLKKRFSKNDGFADKSVIILDPAAGTLTFPAEAISIAKEEFIKKHGSGGWNRLVKEHILNNFYSFEILMAPYAVGHLKISLLLKELGYQLENDERFKLYLTNTLDMTKFKPQQELLAEEISAESEKAYEVKDKTPVLVVMGNPPYQGESENKGEWIISQIEEYKKVDGKEIKEKNIKWLSDDYVKFFRFAQWKIEKTGQGILGFITNHSWLDNPTFKGMRNSLFRTFDEIYILNLHGNTRIKTKVPVDIQKKENIGEKDEGVFGIKTGTAITIAIKLPKPNKVKNIYYSDQWGLRDKKFSWLEKNDIKSTEWVELKPHDPFYFLVQKDESGWDTYNNFVNITDVFPVKSVGIVTARDKLTIQWTENDMWNLVRNFSSMEPELARNAYQLGKDVRDWKVQYAQEDLKASGPDRSRIVPILYRPFDTRFTYYSGKSRGFHCMPRPNVMGNMLKDSNLALVICRQYRGKKFLHALITDKIVESCYVSNKTKEIGYVLPLYIIKDSNQQILLNDSSKDTNINWDALPGSYGTFQPFNSTYSDSLIQVGESIIYYIYAVLYANTYREKYQEFLKTDFPKIPFTSDYRLFQRLAVLGERLVDLHLLKSKLFESPQSHYQGGGDDMVEKRDYHENSNRLYINRSQFFDKVSHEIWNYHIGGYQVLDKWLKDRNGRVLSLEKQLHFRKMITALTQTIDIQKKIDKFYPFVEKSLLL